MARSYGSHYRQRELDKPYKGAEILFNFLGDYLETKDKTVLGYMKHEKEMEALDLARNKYELAKSESAKKGPTTSKDAYGNMLVWDPSTKRYMLDRTQNLKTATTMGQGQYGTKYAKQYFNEYMKDNVVSLDEDGDGKLDKEYFGADANLYKKWSIAKSDGKLKEDALNAMHPDNWLNAMRNKKDLTEEDMRHITGYLEQREKDEMLLSNYQDLQGMNGINIKDDDVRQLYNTMVKNTKPPKLTFTERADITNLMNNRNKLIAIRDKHTEYTTYEASGTVDYGSETDDSGLVKSSVKTTITEFTDTMRGELQWIEGQLKDRGISINPANDTNPPIKASWVK